MNSLERIQIRPALAFDEANDRGPVFADTLGEFGGADFVPGEVGRKLHLHIVPNRHLECKDICAHPARAVPVLPGHNDFMGIGMKTPPHFLKEWRKYRGMTQDDLAAKASIDRSAISKIEAGKAPLMQDRLAAYAAALDIDVSQLYVEPPKEGQLLDDIHMHGRAKKLVGETSLGGVRSATGAPALNGPKDLKVRGFAKAGVVGFYPDNGEALEVTERPPMLIGVSNAYAVYIDDISMYPALKPGHLAWVHPFKPAREGDYVIIQLPDGQAFIKEYVRKAGEKYICRQYNPPQEVKYPEKGTVVHLVVGVRTSG